MRNFLKITLFALATSVFVSCGSSNEEPLLPEGPGKENVAVKENKTPRDIDVSEFIPSRIEVTDVSTDVTTGKDAEKSAKFTARFYHPDKVTFTDVTFMASGVWDPNKPLQNRTDSEIKTSRQITNLRHKHDQLSTGEVKANDLVVILHNDIVNMIMFKEKTHSNGIVFQEIFYLKE
ncbi:MAG TPA: hypothetical protein PK950_00250 [Candidatus Paceibacterota bacterium]|nr:hypothetical protein [Candidatus Paceibacterota bacterium]